MPKITKSTRGTGERETIQAKTTEKKELKGNQSFRWWKAKSRAQLAEEVLSTAGFLKTHQAYRYRQASIFSRLYGNHPLNNFGGASGKIEAKQNNLPIDRPTMNVIQSCVDTLVSRLTQGRPRPVFLTDNGDYKERNLGKQLNQFIQGELFSCKAYQLGKLVLRDAAVLGTGVIQDFEQDCKVALDRVLLTELFVDPNEALYGNPRSLFRLKLVDRSVLAEIFPKYRSLIANAEQAYPDSSGESSQTASDQVMVVEAWHLPSRKGADDGKHVIVCTEGVIHDDDDAVEVEGQEEKIPGKGFTKDRFPFTFMHFSPRMLGFWGQGLAEQLMGTQIEINKLLITTSQAINLVGVPRVFVEKGSKIVKAHLNNQVGSIVEYSGTMPSYQVAPCMPQEVYAQMQRLIQYAYQQSGISELAASSTKPSGLTSGEALREYDDLQSDRFAALASSYDNFFIDLAYRMIDRATDIAEREGSYKTVYPNKNGTKEVDLPKSQKLLENTYVIQCFDSSSLPRDPAGRLQKITEMMQAAIISPEEGRRLLDYPDLEQEERLANASEERILQILDQIVDTGKYTPPDPFMNFALAERLTTAYYNLYAASGLEEEKAGKLRDFFTQIQALKQAAMPPAMPAAPGAVGPDGQPMATPQAPPVSDLLSNVPGAA